jgi:Flp pilus assembly pilin Flp
MKKSGRKPKSESEKRRSRGATLLEYTLLITLVVGGCVVAITQLGTVTSSSFSNQTLINALQN